MVLNPNLRICLICSFMFYPKFTSASRARYPCSCRYPISYMVIYLNWHQLLGTPSGVKWRTNHIRTSEHCGRWFSWISSSLTPHHMLMILLRQWQKCDQTFRNENKFLVILVTARFLSLRYRNIFSHFIKQAFLSATNGCVRIIAHKVRPD